MFFYIYQHYFILAFVGQSFWHCSIPGRPYLTLCGPLSFAAPTSMSCSRPSCCSRLHVPGNDWPTLCPLVNKSNPGCTLPEAITHHCSQMRTFGNQEEAQQHCHAGLLVSSLQRPFSRAHMPIFDFKLARYVLAFLHVFTTKTSTKHMPWRAILTR